MSGLLSPEAQAVGVQGDPPATASPTDSRDATLNPTTPPDLTNLELSPLDPRLLEEALRQGNPPEEGVINDSTSLDSTSADPVSAETNPDAALIERGLESLSSYQGWLFYNSRAEQLGLDAPSVQALLTDYLRRLGVEIPDLGLGTFGHNLLGAVRETLSNGGLGAALSPTHIVELVREYRRLVGGGAPEPATPDVVQQPTPDRSSPYPFSLQRLTGEGWAERATSPNNPGQEGIVFERPHQTVFNPYPGAPTVVIDPGHGGSEPGAVRGGTEEEDLTLYKSRIIAQRLLELGVNVVMTRNSDVDVSLARRAQLAGQYGADAFLSVHFNAHGSDASGVETFYRHGSSGTLAANVQNAMLQASSEIGYDQPNRGVKNANFYVISRNEPGVPAVLSEGAFISGSQDRARLISDSALVDHQAMRIAEALARTVGIQNVTQRPVY